MVLSIGSMVGAAPAVPTALRVLKNRWWFIPDPMA